jgi:serine/threonine protein phosphatase 1
VSVFVIGDVHGCHRTLDRLLKSLPMEEGDRVCLVGDLIDRGPHSAACVQLVIDEGHDCVLGNHEEFMVMSVLEGRDERLWVMNGGNWALASYRGDEDLLKSHAAWMNALPLVIEYPELGLVVSHSSAAVYYKAGKNDAYRDSVLWDRASFPFRIPGLFNVFGHTPAVEPRVKDHWACIDTGCTFGSEGVLTALRFPEMEIFQQKNLDHEDRVSMVGGASTYVIG